MKINQDYRRDNSQRRIENKDTLFLVCTVYNRELTACNRVFPSTNIYLQMPDVFEACPGAENNPGESECLGYV